MQSSSSSHKFRAKSDPERRFRGPRIPEQWPVIVAVVLAAVFWFADAALDWFFFYDTSYAEIATGTGAPQEIFMRVLGAGLLVAFGLFMTRELTKRKQAEENLVRLSQRNELILCSAGEGILGLDLQGNHTFINPAAARMLGYEAGELLGYPSHSVWHHSKPDGSYYPKEECKIYAAYRDGTVHSVSTEVFWRKDGTSFPVAYRSTPIYDQGRIVGAVVTFTDITARRRLEQELVRSERLRAVGELSAGVCHNLNNLLTGVLVPAEMLQMTGNDPKTQHLAGMILEAGTRAAELVHRLHLSVRGAPAEPLAPIALNQSIDGVVQMTRPKWKDGPEAKGLIIEVRTALAEVPPIKGTLSELHDLLINLLFNAVDAMPQGGTITIRTALEGGFVQLDFSDTGTGMDEETRLRIFEPFFTTKRDVGSGLGLSTLNNSVTHWGGTVRVESTPGKGTTFTLRFPVWEKEVAGAPPNLSPAVGSRPGRVLIIEDQQAVGKVLMEVLRTKHQVAVFADGGQALEQFSAGKYDVVILDLGLPGMSGDQVAQRIQEVDPAVARILFTGWELEAQDPRRRLFDFALQKPLRDLHALEEVVAQAIVLRDQRVEGV